jgi:hypothetical protein
MYDFEIIAERKIPKTKNGKKKIEREVAMLFSSVPAIVDDKIVKMIVNAADPLKVYIDALTKQAENSVLDAPVNNRIYQILDTQKPYTQKDCLKDILFEVSSYTEMGWTVRLVY